MTRNDAILGRYEPLGTAGEGGFGTVQVAWDPRIQRKVAVKTIRLTAVDAARAALPGAQATSEKPVDDRWHGVQPWNEYLDDPFAESPFPADPSLPVFADGPEPQIASAQEQVTFLSHMPGLDEARTAALLDDPRIVTVYDFEVRGRNAYLIMEYVEGITLTKVLSDYADYITLDMLAAVFDSVAGALATAHAGGVLHLDIKPDNILISTQGQVKVTDFGLATLADAAGEGTAGGGTVGYMPPEQIRREHLDARADEWSLAAVTYEMLTGSNPFRVNGVAEALDAIEQAELVLPSLCWKNIDEQIDDVVFYALDPDRNERYATVSDFAEEVDKFLGDAERGTAQLQLVVEDALGLAEEESEQEGDEPIAPAYPDEVPDSAPHGAFGRMASALSLVKSGFSSGGAHDGPTDAAAGMQRGAPAGAQPPRHRRSLTERFLDVLPEADDAVDETWDDGEDDVRTASGTRGDRTAQMPRAPLSERMPGPLRAIIPRAYSAAASGFVAALAFTNIDGMSAFGPGATYVVALLVACVAIAGAIRSHVGALIACSLLGIAFVACGHPVMGAVVLIATVAWWYTVGHGETAPANVVLALPLLGAFGAASAVPLLSGRCLGVVKALGTTLFAGVIAVMLASLGTQSVLGWDALLHWDFGRGDLTGALLRTLTQPVLWTTLAGWMGATAVLALACSHDSRALRVVGIAVALALVLAGNLVLAPPSPELLVTSIMATAALIVLEL